MKQSVLVRRARPLHRQSKQVLAAAIRQSTALAALSQYVERPRKRSTRHDDLVTGPRLRPANCYAVRVGKVPVLTATHGIVTDLRAE